MRSLLTYWNDGGSIGSPAAASTGFAATAGEATPRYWLTRFVILRLLGVVYLFAFLVAANQILPLVGSNGLLPLDDMIEVVDDRLDSRFAAFRRLPSVFWWLSSDEWLVGSAWAGAALSLLVVAGFANSILMAVLWALYMSFVHVGQDWYGYGWEIQLLETGFLGIFLCPLIDPRPFPRRPPSAQVVWLYRWLIFRIMLGAGLIKLRGDPCWRDLTCLYYHYETQPIPNPLSAAIHFMPRWFHQTGTLFNHFTELVAPWLVIIGRHGRNFSGVVMLVFQVSLILSGNLSFLNYLTIVPVLACFDDTFLRRTLPRRLVARADRAAREARVSRGQTIASWALVALVSVLSIDPVGNLLSGNQIMNTSFNALELVNTYGAFGSVGKDRYEIVFEGTNDSRVTGETRWKAYEFPCKPGDATRRPCVMSPYQYRLDWQIWFAAMSSPERYPWTLHLVWKLLHGDPTTLSLLAGNPFPDAPPRWVRAQYYRYRFAPPGDPEGRWWERTLVGSWLPPLSAEDPRLLEFLRRNGWIDEPR